ncbi:MAG: transposase [Gammaproteobacteria bacterium]|nr:transposase [Gammaproteobacteria bacterium]
MPGLIDLLKSLPIDGQPEFIRGDIAWGTDGVMSQLEELYVHYLFKLKKTPRIKDLISKNHCEGNWTYIDKNWEAKEDRIQLHGWEKSRRVVIVRRQLSSKEVLGLGYEVNGQQQLAFIEEPENMQVYTVKRHRGEYSVLVTDLDANVVSIFYHYRDRADCENNFDEIKNQWGWGGFSTQKLSSCQLISRIIALVFNWWNFFVRLAIPDKHHEAITSRPLLLSSIGKLTETGRQRKMTIISTHGDTKKLKLAYTRLVDFFKRLKSIAPQFSFQECWALI